MNKYFGNLSENICKYLFFFDFIVILLYIASYYIRYDIIWYIDRIFIIIWW